MSAEQPLIETIPVADSRAVVEHFHDTDRDFVRILVNDQVIGIGQKQNVFNLNRQALVVTFFADRQQDVEKSVIEHIVHTAEDTLNVGHKDDVYMSVLGTGPKTNSWDDTMALFNGTFRELLPNNNAEDMNGIVRSINAERYENRRKQLGLAS